VFVPSRSYQQCHDDVSAFALQLRLGDIAVFEALNGPDPRRHAAVLPLARREVAALARIDSERCLTFVLATQPVCTEREGDKRRGRAEFDGDTFGGGVYATQVFTLSSGQTITSARVQPEHGSNRPVGAYLDHTD